MKCLYCKEEIRDGECACTRDTPRNGYDRTTYKWCAKHNTEHNGLCPECMREASERR